MKLQDFQAIGEATDMKMLRQRLVNFAHKRDFGLISGVLVIENGTMPAKTWTFGNVPDAFRPAFDNAELSRRNPVMRRLKRLSIPFTYDQSMYLEERAVDLWDLQAQFGYKTGIATALHLPKCTHFLIGIDREAPLPRSQDAVTRLMADLQLFAVHAVDVSTRLLLKDAHVSEHDWHLTNRELEVLRWTLDGKTAWEVGMLLNISERTAAIHANRASHKLGCISKHQAALKAMRLGLI